MKILFAASEMTPLVKTGGLADVAGALPRAMAALGHDVAVILPFYGSIDRTQWEFQRVIPELVVELPAGRRVPAVWYVELPGETPKSNPVTVFLVEDRGLYQRRELYAVEGREYPDNALRFGYFSLATLYAIKELGWIPDVIHCNDWQTALIPVYLKRRRTLANDPAFAGIRTLFSIHNLSYQGLYPGHTIEQLGLPIELMQVEELEFHGMLNLLKGGLVYSDQLATVSPTYAQEVQTQEYGCGLNGLLHTNAHRLTGILNGIDTHEWNPETDPHLPANYSRADPTDKAVCKAALQREFGLPEDPRVPLLGLVSRLADQKGFDILTQALTAGGLLEGDVQFVALGSGQPEYHTLLEWLRERYPGKAGVRLGFDNGLAHRIEAGSDMFLMPSRFEPCGLNQLYSLRYGTPPLVRRTGGLADSITHATPKTIASGMGDGFAFDDYTSEALLETLSGALELYNEDGETWTRLMDNAMRRDHSWRRAAREYESLMEKMVAHV